MKQAVMFGVNTGGDGLSDAGDDQGANGGCHQIAGRDSGNDFIADGRKYSPRKRNLLFNFCSFYSV